MRPIDRYRGALIWYRGALIWVLLTSLLAGQVPINPPGLGPRPLPPQQQFPVQAQPNQQQQQTNPNAAAQAAPQPAPSGPPTVYGGITFNNASLTEVIDMLARQLHINYVLDPRVKGGVILNTYGETKNIESREAGLNKEIHNDRAANGGTLTPQEHQQVNQQQNNLSHSIYDDKHNARTDHPVERANTQHAAQEHNNAQHAREEHPREEHPHR